MPPSSRPSLWGPPIQATPIPSPSLYSHLMWSLPVHTQCPILLENPGIPGGNADFPLVSPPPLEGGSLLQQENWASQQLAPRASSPTQSLLLTAVHTLPSSSFLNPGAAEPGGGTSRLGSSTVPKMTGLTKPVTSLWSLAFPPGPALLGQCPFHQPTSRPPPPSQSHQLLIKFSLPLARLPGCNTPPPFWLGPAGASPGDLPSLATPP